MLTCQNLLSVISFVSGQSEDAILGPSRSRGLVLCRHVFYHVARKKMGLKLVQIGAFFNKDHTTILHGLSKIDDMVSINDEIVCNFLEQVNNCIKEKYLIPIKIMLTIPHDKNYEDITSWLTLQGCEIDKISFNFDSSHT
jgi:hypothetical protein